MTYDGSITNQNVLPPTTVRAIHEAFDDALKMLEEGRILRMPYARRQLRGVVARHIVELAKHGECNVDRLRERALTALHFYS